MTKSAEQGSKPVRARWESSFADQIAAQAYNSTAVEALVRTLSYHFRETGQTSNFENLRFLEMGCGTGPNLMWLAQKGIRVSGLDISPTALALARARLVATGCGDRIAELVEGSVADAPFPSESFDGILEACVFQHLAKADRERAFAEVRRLLKPGGVFVGYMLETGHTIFHAKKAEQESDDPGTLILRSGTSGFNLENLGLSHFFSRDEVVTALAGFAVVDPCLTTYELPAFEARKRGYLHYRQSMWTVYAVR